MIQENTSTYSNLQTKIDYIAYFGRTIFSRFSAPVKEKPSNVTFNHNELTVDTDYPTIRNIAIATSQYQQNLLFRTFIFDVELDNEAKK